MLKIIVAILVLIALAPEARAEDQDPRVCEFVASVRGEKTTHKVPCDKEKIYIYLPHRLRPNGALRATVFTYRFFPYKPHNFPHAVKDQGRVGVKRCQADALFVLSSNPQDGGMRIDLTCGQHKAQGKPIYQDEVWTVAWQGDDTDLSEVIALAKR